MERLTPVLLCLAAVAAFAVAGVVQYATAPSGPAPSTPTVLVAGR